MPPSLRTPAAVAVALVLLVPVVTFAADGPAAPGAVPTDPSAPVASPAPDARPPLEGTRWHLREYRADDGGLAGAYDGGWLTLSHGAFTGSSGCEDVSGAYALVGDSLVLTDISPTEASCLDGDIAVQEMALLARLPTTTTVAFEGARLWLADATGGRNLGFVSIVGPEWVQMYDGAEPMPEGVVSLRFGTAGVRGQGPCNVFGGPFAQDATAIAIGPLESTRTACPDLDLENELLSDLQAAGSYAIESGDLVLFDEQGAALRRFAEASTAD